MLMPNRRSFLYRLDPGTKLFLTALFTVMVFLVDRLSVAAALLLFFIILSFSSGIPVKRIFSRYKILFFLVVFVVIIQMLFGRETPETRYLLKPLIPERIPLAGGAGSLKLDGLFTGLMIGCRITALSVLMPLLTETTEPRLLSYGLTRLGFNYRAAYVITSALNLIPQFEEEARQITDACRLRGVTAFDRGSIFSRLKEYPALAFPLIVKAMKQASVMSLAMDARAFGAHKTRTWLIQIKPGFIDYTTLAAGIIFFVIAVTANYMLKITT